MTTDEWAKVRHFKASEFDSPDSPGSGHAGMDARFVTRLDELRERWGKPMTINSGLRTQAHNAIVGGKPNSAHLRGLGADIKTAGLAEAIRLAVFAAMHGFVRIGIDQQGRFVHLDADAALPSAQWWYHEGTFA